MLKSLLKIEGEEKEYEILYSVFEVHQTLDDAGSITSPMQYAHFYLEIFFTNDDYLLNWANEPESPKNLVIEEYTSRSTLLKSVSLKNAYCTQWEEKFDFGFDRGLSEYRSRSSHNFITCLTLTAGEIAVNDATLQNF